MLPVWKVTSQQTWCSAARSIPPLVALQVTSGVVDLINPTTDGSTKFMWTAEYRWLSCGGMLSSVADHGAGVMQQPPAGYTAMMMMMMMMLTADLIPI